jgi:hypothetical protein
MPRLEAFSGAGMEGAARPGGRRSSEKTGKRMPQRNDMMDRLFEEQVERLQELHYLILLWAVQSEGKSLKYNITNLFDDLKSAGKTRTKQTAVAAVAALATLRFIDIREEHNRKNIYITNFGAKALESMMMRGKYKESESTFLEGR